MIRKIVLSILKCPLFRQFFLIKALELHNLSYQIAGMLAPTLEQDDLHPKHRLMKYHAWFTERLDKDWDVLDIGCGNGALAFDIKTSCRSVTGIDISGDNINIAKSKFSGPGLEFIRADALAYRFDKKFHAIVLSNVLEHINNRVEFLKKVYRCQDMDNPPVLLLRVPMITRDWITLYKREKGVEWRLDATHFTEYTLDEVFDEMKQAGLCIEHYDIGFGEFYGVIKKVGV